MYLFSIINLVIILALLGISIYCMVLFIKLARRGIVALDLYIGQNQIKPMAVETPVVSEEATLVERSEEDRVEM